MNNTYKKALEFWNNAFEMDEDAKNEYKQEYDPVDGWKELCSSAKLQNVIIDQLASRNRVLDYGCGEGWAGITLNKSGCKDVTCVDVGENAIELCKCFKNHFNIEKGLRAECVSTDWLKNEPAESYEGIFCSNVVDVLPADVALDIIKNFARITTKDAKIVIAMNFYAEPVSKPEKKIEFKNGNEMYVNGILRMTTRTDEDWSEIFSQFFNVEEVTYFAWDGEDEETRRIFVISKK
jgi:SAM-dependent methyltransferase